MTDIEKKLLDLIEHPVFILKPDDKGSPRYVAFNAYACRSHETSENKVLGLTAAELYAGRMGEMAYTHHVEALKSAQETVYESQQPIAGNYRLVRTTLRPILDENGAVDRLIGTSTDISGGQIFSAMKTEIETIAGEIEEFVSLAAHDLRAPMRNVSQIAEMLREDFQDLGDGKIELIDILEEVGEKALRLVSDVLAHAQATASIEETVEFDFEDLAAEVSAVLDPLNTCEISYDSGCMRGDRTAVQIILRNLVDNSIKHAKPPGTSAKDLSLNLSISVIDRQNGLFEVRVADNGRGFSDAALEFLTGGKLRVDSGFGLLGVRRLISARGGSIRVANRKDTSGAIVAFTLPGSFVTAAETPQLRQAIS